ncbi:MAG: hypothetical protein ACYTEU_12385 [Planctomycetota bacterium]
MRAQVSGLLNSVDSIFDFESAAHIDISINGIKDSPIIGPHYQIGITCIHLHPQLKTSGTPLKIIFVQIHDRAVVRMIGHNIIVGTDS